MDKHKFFPIVIDNLDIGHEYAVKWGPLIKADITDKETLDRVFSQCDIEAVMHFAGAALVGESMVNPVKYYHNNVTGTINLLNAMKKHGVKHFIFSSTCSTYGVPNTIPITEDHIQKPINPYGKSKYMIEQILKDMENAHDIRFASLRYFNAAGADLEAEIGENHIDETHLIPLVLESLTHKNTLKVFGNDFKTKDGTAIRDYIHVLDIAQAHVKALEWIISNNESLSINLGTGQGFSVLDIINTAEKVCNDKISYEITNRREGDPPILIANNTKAKKLLNWELKHSDIDTIINSAWKWHLHLHENIR